MSDRVILVGCGNMGFAMLKGWIDSGVLRPDDVHVVEPADALRERAGGLGVHIVADAGSLPADLKPRMVLIAVKPQVMAQILPAYARFAETASFVSVAAGIPVALLETYLDDKTAIIRCMPNTPAAIGKGMLVTYRNANVNDEDATFVADLLKTSGQVASIADESLMDAVTAVSGSGPAYVFHFIECLTDAGITAGLERDTAALLAMQTVYGAGALAAASSDSPSKLREQVTSPNGTTAAALAVLMDDNRLKNLVEDAVEAAKTRSIELGKS
ncbi:pyrroline-5-carboxylate reductase [Phyllobacterium phragmitis]|uniref:Pyrroline-5-carboxylate reductase n=1 Tax=Phyllobacterium phragmitis TaxID=2670329 RepID=A0A2S9IL22_9HYPH|nr:pyrroline-5-carboxylate reductase [Phyllobacterium phragmitis]PRD41227.1 pyrroline-5-carboxylate reductase [Phyllobacterium phragmitis]